MQVAAQASIATLVPAIIEELKLPRSDLFGNRLVYVLRYAHGGPVLPEDRSLEAAGVSEGAMLALDSYVMDGSVGTLIYRQQQSQPLPQGFFSSETLADFSALPALQLHTPAALPVVKRSRRGRRSRRAFLLLAGAALGMGSAGLSYAAYRTWMTGTQATHSAAMLLNTPANKTPAPTQSMPVAAKHLFVFTQHSQAVRSVAWSRDGAILASGGDDAQVMLWNTNGVVQVQHQLSGSVRAVALSPDGSQLASASNDRVTWFDTQSGEQLAQSGDTHAGTVTTLAWSLAQPALLVSGATDDKAVVWLSATHTAQIAFTAHTTAIDCAAWAADNQTIATSSDGGAVRVWSANDGQEVHPFFLDASLPMRALAFHPTTNRLAVGGDDGIVRFWNGLTCQQTGQAQFGTQCADTPSRLQAHHGVIRALAWSPDGSMLATGGDDGLLALWSITQVLPTMPLLTVQQNDPILALGWSPGGKQLATASGNTVTLWSLN